jgi:hypothetical protein
MRKIVSLLTVLLLLAALPFGASAEEDIQALVDALPGVEEIQLMNLEEQQEAYIRVQEVYELYAALGENRLKIVGGEEKFDLLFSWFNAQVMPLEQEPEEEPEQDVLSNLVSTALAVIPVILLLRYMEKKRVR